MQPISSSVLHLSELLLQRSWRCVTAESCTGGGIAYCLTEQAGSSTWFERGFITYTNQAKQQNLGVDENVLIQHGAVSEPTARAMALGALSRSDAQAAMAVTGIAGPGGGSDEKPVGTVCFGWGWGENEVETETQWFTGDRHTIRVRTVEHAIRGLCERLESLHQVG